MPYTGQLGTSLSAPGNIVLGSIGLNLDQGFSDTLDLDEVWVAGLQSNEIIDTITYDEIMLCTVVWARDWTDTLILDDGFVELLSDTLDLDDLLEYSQTIFPIASDTLTYSDTISTELTGSVSMIDGLNFADPMNRPVMSFYRAYGDTLTLNESWIGYISRNAADTLTYTETWDTEKSYGFRDVLALGDAFIREMTYNRRMASVLEPYDSFTALTFLNKSFSDTLTFTDQMQGNKNRPLQTDILTYSDTMTGVQSKALLDSLTLTEAWVVSKSLAAVFTDFVLLNDEPMRANFRVDTSYSDTLPLNEVWQGIRNRFGVSSDTLTYTDQFRREIIAALFSNNLNYSETWTVNRDSIHTFGDGLPLVDAMSYQSTLNLSGADTLQYYDDFYIYKRGAGVTIRGLGLTIVLPAPEFNDFEANQNKMIVGRSMTGDFRTYVKRTDREKVNWRFIIPQPKKDELQAFILAEINNPLIVDDFKGRRWSFKFLSDTIDFTEMGRWAPCGNKFEVTLEFEGTRYYG